MRSLRSLGALVLVFLLLAGATPVGAWGAVTLTWERNWGSDGTADGQFVGPTDVATDKWGNVYVAGGGNGDHRVQMFTEDGVFIIKRGTTGAGDTDLTNPFCITVDRWGNSYVGEQGNGGRVHTFGWQFSDWNGTFDGSGPSAITTPYRIGVTLDERLYLTDPNTGNVQRWTVYKSYMDSITPLGTPTMGLGVSQDGFVYTTTDNVAGLIHRAIVYDWLWGNAPVSWGGFGTGNGQFDRPYDVETDPLGRAYVVEAEGDRGQVFSPTGEFLATFGSLGGGDGQFWIPYGVGVGPDRTVYVADYANERISKWNVGVPTEVANVAGGNRITTAIAASQKAYPYGAPTVILATAYNWPDALGGATLAGVMDAPILLVPPTALPAEVAAEIDRLGCGKAYVLGGEGAVGPAVFNAVKAQLATHDVERLGGTNRYETANLIATEAVQNNPTYSYYAFVCTGESFPDALSVAPIAAANGWPIYLTDPDALLPSVRSTMLANISHHGSIIGGEGAVSKAVADELNAAPFFGFGRIAGDNRYQTSAEVARRGFEDMGMLFSRPALATGEDFPDALAGGALQGSDACPILLTRSGSLSWEAANLLTVHKDSIYEIRYIGGSAAIAPSVRNAARSMLW